MKLIIAEKPLLGKAIADAIPGKSTYGNSVIFKGEYTIIWCFGHLLELKPPEVYDEKYKRWSLSDLPIYFDPWEKVIISDKNQDKKFMSKTERVNQIGEYIKKADIVINAGDNDDEGSLLINEIIDWFNYTGPAYRLNTNDITKEALAYALENMVDNSQSIPQSDSAYARQLADAIFGFNPTRFYSIKYNQLLSFGRVQVPVLGLVVNRDRLIEQHNKTHFYEMFTEISTPTNNKDFILAKFVPDAENNDLTDGKFLTSTYLEGKENDITGQKYQMTVQRRIEVKKPPLPFNLTALTVYCEKKFKLSPDKVMETTQSLRENHKAISYNRTDCQYLSESQWKEAPSTIRSVAANLNLNANQYDASLHSDCFNDEKITAHFAIIPTNQNINIKNFTDAELAVYTAISNYYLAQFKEPAEYEKTTLTCELENGEYLRANSSKLIKLGFLEQFGNYIVGEVDSNEVLAAIPTGSFIGKVESCSIIAKETKPLPRYTEASLYKDTTSISKYVTNPETKRILLEKDKGKTGENGSIGTPATRTAIIKRLITVGYLEIKKGKNEQLISTEKGRAFFDMLPNEIKEVDITARWFIIQEDIKAGKATPQDLARDVLETVNKYVLKAPFTASKNIAAVTGKSYTPFCVCKNCGGVVADTAKAWACTNRCGATIWKDNKFFQALGHNVTPQVAKALLEKGEVRLNNCVGKSGKEFGCIVSMNIENEKASMDIKFPGSEPVGKCPICKSSITENKAGYGCTNKDCNIILWKNTKRYNDVLAISRDNAQLLLSGKKVLFSITDRKGIKGKKELGIDIVKENTSGKYYVNLN